MTVRLSLPSAAQFADFRREAGWDVPDPDRCRRAMDSSLCGAVAYVDDQPVSMARLVGDGHINIYLQDVITRKAYRGQGHAGHVIRALLTHAQHQYAPDLTIGLFAADGQDGVYAPFGFRTRPCNGYGPGMFARLGDLAIADNRQ